MSNKTLPKRNIICAYDDIAILDFYEKHYDTVYIILHPFFKVKDSTKLDYETEYPDKNQISNLCELITWKDFLKLSKIENIETLDIALRNSTGGLKKRYSNNTALKKLNKASEQHQIYHPNEGMFEDTIIDSMCQSLISLGLENIIAGNEFGDEKRSINIRDIIENRTKIESSELNLYSENNEILYTVHWDSHYTMLCSNRKNVEKIVSDFNFEGFYCKKKTDIYWSIKD